MTSPEPRCAAEEGDEERDVRGYGEPRLRPTRSGSLPSRRATPGSPALGRGRRGLRGARGLSLLTARLRRHAHGLASGEMRRRPHWQGSVEDANLRVPGVAVADRSTSSPTSRHRRLLRLLSRRDRAGFRLLRTRSRRDRARARSRALSVRPAVAGLGVVDTLRRFSGIDIASPGATGPTDPVAWSLRSLPAGRSVSLRESPSMPDRAPSAAGAPLPGPGRPHDHRDREPLRPRRACRGPRNGDRIRSGARSPRARGGTISGATRGGAAR